VTGSFEHWLSLRQFRPVRLSAIDGLRQSEILGDYWIFTFMADTVVGGI